ncbi:MAG: ATP-binding protein [Candidatus Nealsonbacteria bacterium DGGOD1a]|jgi:Signal transduction histidine kinase|nr:MAG: ATP-binding protein [Candidatus Nealsonbacteria bacterium DGGOD1a]
MKEFIKNALYFIKQNPAILYSLSLIVLLPFALYVYTFFTIQSFQSVLENNIQTQAAALKDRAASLLLPDFPAKGAQNVAALQETIGNFAEENKGFENLRVIIREGKDYKVIAAQNNGNVGKVVSTDISLNGEGLVAYSWSNGTEIHGWIKENNKRSWRIIQPFIDENAQEVYALISIDTSFESVDNSINIAVWQSYLLLAVIVLISLFLVFQHTRLFRYVVLAKESQEQIVAKDNFIRMATHELRSPVTVIMAYIEALKDELAAVITDDQKQYIERVSISIKNLNDLMADILEVSHLQQGRTDFKPEKIVVAEVVKEIVDGIKQKAEDKGLALTFESENPVAMLGDTQPANPVIMINVNPVCFKRIIVNLVENSVKYTPAGKVIVSVKTERAKKRCVVTVQDTGFGISAEGQKRLFEQFYRVKTEDNSGIPGTGLGLWMSREMARKMGGDIMLESIERMGSRFFVFFPLANK